MIKNIREAGNGMFDIEIDKLEDLPKIAEALQKAGITCKNLTEKNRADIKTYCKAKGLKEMENKKTFKTLKNVNKTSKYEFNNTNKKQI